MLDRSEFLVGVTVGSGAVASIATRSGADFLLAINAARLRNMGAPSIACMLPLADASRQVEAYAVAEILPLATKPVFAGMTCWHPGFDGAATTKRLLEDGFAGVVNFPPSALYPPEIQRNLERAGVGFGAEIDLLVAAERAGAMALAYCYSISQCRQAALAGVRIILLNLGWNTGGITSPSSNISLDEAAVLAASASRQIRRINADALFLLEGGPIETAEDLAFVRGHAGLDGYVGGSTVERLPVERSITDRIAAFKAADLPQRHEDPVERRTVAIGERAGFVVRSPAMRRALTRLLEGLRRGQPLLYAWVPVGDSFRPVERVLLSQSAGKSARSLIEIDAGSPPDWERLEASVLSRRAALEHEPIDIVLQHADRLPPELGLRLGDLMLDPQPGGAGRRLRIHCLSHCDAERLPALLRDGAFGALCRANQVPLPGLQDRPEDMAALLDQVLGQLGEGGRGGRAVTPAALRRLQAHAWAGNTAELMAVCTRLMASGAKGALPLDAVEAVLRQPAAAVVDGKTAASEEKRHLLAALAQNRFRKGQTAAALGISRKTLYNRMKRHRLS